MSSNSPREYALYIQPEIGDENKNIEENVNHLHNKITDIVESKFAKAFIQFTEDIASSFLELPSTVHDVNETDILQPTNKKQSICVDNKLSLAELGLAGFKAPKIETPVSNIRIETRTMSELSIV